MGDEGGSPWCPNNDDEQCRRSSSGCHITVSNVAPDLLSEKSMGQRRAAHLSLPSPVSIQRCWPSFVSRSFAFICGLSLSFGVVSPGGHCG